MAKKPTDKANDSTPASDKPKRTRGPRKVKGPALDAHDYGVLANVYEEQCTKARLDEKVSNEDYAKLYERLGKVKALHVAATQKTTTPTEEFRPEENLQ